MKAKIDWRKPAYATAVTSNATWRRGLRRCCQCGARIQVGERYKRGPRGRENIHEACVDAAMGPAPVVVP
jgi:hypothetical protein